MARSTTAMHIFVLSNTTPNMTDSSNFPVPGCNEAAGLNRQQPGGPGGHEDHLRLGWGGDDHLLFERGPDDHLLLGRWRLAALQGHLLVDLLQERLLPDRVDGVVVDGGGQQQEAGHADVVLNTNMTNMNLSKLTL